MSREGLVEALGDGSRRLGIDGRRRGATLRLLHRRSERWVGDLLVVEVAGHTLDGSRRDLAGLPEGLERRVPGRVGRLRRIVLDVGELGLVEPRQVAWRGQRGPQRREVAQPGQGRNPVSPLVRRERPEECANLFGLPNVVLLNTSLVVCSKSTMPGKLLRMKSIRAPCPYCSACLSIMMAMA